MTQQQLADALHLHQSQVSRYVRRGMPMDVAGAQDWLRQNVMTTMRAPRHRSAAPQPSAVEVLMNAYETIVLLHRCREDERAAFDEGIGHLAMHLRMLPADMVTHVRMPARVHAALVAYIEAHA